MIRLVQRSISKLVDFRSDTVTLPPPGMKEAMIAAPLGDDVYGEDPTVNAFQKRIADMLGMESALLVPSGTMGNFLGLLMHCQRGDEILIGDYSHVYCNEQANWATLGGVAAKPLPTNSDGTISIDTIRSAILPENIHHANQKLIVIENTHNQCGGRVLTPEYLHQVNDLAREQGLLFHIDGARYFNAYYALKAKRPELTVADMVGGADSVNICFSKGLSCPVGSVLIGTDKDIYLAKRWRKAVGGGMRQAGLLAAAADFALDASEEIMTKDHEHAQILRAGLADLGCTVHDVETNIVMFGHEKFTVNEFVAKLKGAGVLVKPILYGGGNVRAVLNSGVTSSDVELALERFKSVINLQ